MAAVIISFKMKDAEDRTTTTAMYYDSADVTTLADAQGIATDFAPLLNAVSGCVVIGAEVAFPLTVPAGGNADAGYRVDAGATLSFYNSAGRAWSMFVPGWLLSRLSNGVVDTSAADVTNLTNAIITGGGITGGLQASDPNELDLTAYRQGIQSTRKTRR